MQQYELNKVLKEKVDRMIGHDISDQWLYYSRLKSEESYVLKIESGRVQDPSQLEDFFACIIVVENNNKLIEAVQTIEALFKVIERRPETCETKKLPEVFSYDSLRLYAVLKNDPGVSSTGNILSNITFEIQIKTFLQHAGDIATHDLVYKGSERNWAKQRIAYQVKAMLEHAELSIYEIDNVKNSELLNKSYKEFDHLNNITEFLKKHWPSETLPKDLIRLSRNVSDLLKLLNMNISTLDALLHKKSLARNVTMSDLSPYLAIIQTIFDQSPRTISRFLQNPKVVEKRLLIPPEINTGDIQLSSNKIILID